MAFPKIQTDGTVSVGGKKHMKCCPRGRTGAGSWCLLRFLKLWPPLLPLPSLREPLAPNCICTKVMAFWRKGKASERVKCVFFFDCITLW